MTINVVVHIPDGIVIASDSRLSGLRRYDRGKIEKFYLNDDMEKILLVNNGKIGVTYNSDSDFNGKTMPEIIKEFNGNELILSDSVFDVAQKLRIYFSKNYSSLNTVFYVSGYIKEEQHVYLVSKDLVRRENVNNYGMFYGITCSGNLKIASMFNELVNINIFKEMDLNKAIEFAEFYIQTTITWLNFNERYADCGGPIDILIITPNSAYFHKSKFTNVKS